MKHVIKELNSIGIKVQNNKVKKSDILAVLKQMTSAYKTKEQAIKDCIDYILEHEAEDYADQLSEYFETKEDFEKDWKSFQHIFTSALIAAGEEPDFDLLKD